jgi:hypothetical protein
VVAAEASRPRQQAARSSCSNSTFACATACQKHNPSVRASAGVVSKMDTKLLTAHRALVQDEALVRVAAAKVLAVARDHVVTPARLAFADHHARHLVRLAQLVGELLGEQPQAGQLARLLKLLHAVATLSVAVGARVVGRRVSACAARAAGCKASPITVPAPAELAQQPKDSWHTLKRARTGDADDSHGRHRKSWCTACWHATVTVSNNGNSF